MPSLGSNLLLRPVELGSVDPRPMQNDRELTRDCNLALRSPLRLASLITADHFGTRVSRTPAASTKRLLVHEARIVAASSITIALEADGGNFT